MAGRPRTRQNRKLGRTCGAYARSTGKPCQRMTTFKGGKCCNHGGLSLSKADKARITRETGRTFRKTGPATPEGKARSYAARDAGRARRWELFRNARGNARVTPLAIEA